MTGATQSYTESVLKVMTPTSEHTSVYVNSGIIFLRSVTENLINISFIYACDTQKNAAVFHVDWLQSTIKFANRYKQLMVKYPGWNLTFGDKVKASDWESYISYLKKKIQKDQRHFKTPLTKLPTIEQRCIEHDKYLDSKGRLKEGNSLEKLYVTYYPYFSGIAHLTSGGLNSFRNYLEDGSFNMDIDSNPEDIDVVVLPAYASYLNLLSFFLKRFDIHKGTEIAKFRTKLKELGEKRA